MIVIVIISILYICALTRVLSEDRSDIKGLKIPKWRVPSRGTDTIDRYIEYMKKGVDDELSSKYDIK